MQPPLGGALGVGFTQAPQVLESSLGVPNAQGVQSQEVGRRRICRHL
jgi:hypothetical protein